MSKFRNTILVALLVCTSLGAKAQQGIYNIDFAVMFDNIENSKGYTPPRTFFSVALSPTIGVRFEGKHSLMVGADVLQIMGDSIFPSKIDYTIFYQYDNNGLRVTAGSIPRTKLIGDYPTSFFRTNYEYYNKNFKGFSISHQGQSGYAEAFCDWYGASQRLSLDEFMLVGTARYELFDRMWIVGGNILLNHFANKYYLADSYLLERLQYNVYTGVNFQPLLPALDKLSISGGVLSTLECRRYGTTSTGWINHAGWQVDVEFEWKGFFFKNSTFWGAPQFEYLDHYGAKVYQGEVFYNSNFYNRTEGGYTYRYKFLKVFGGVIFHFMEQRVVNQQVIRLEINFGDVFASKKKAKK